MKEYTYQWNPEWADDESKPILKITKSSLSCFGWCKRQYQHQYIERLPTDQSPAMLKGSMVHNAEETMWNEFDLGVATSLPLSEIEDYITGLFPIDEYGAVYDNMVALQSQRFRHAVEQDTLDSFLPVGNEVKLDAEWVVAFDINPKYELSRNYIVHLQGIIDRVFLEDGEYFPIELKTGHWKDGRLSKMRGEMAFYKLLMDLEGSYSPVTKWGWFFPESNYAYIEDVKRSSYTALLKRFATLLWAYEQGEFPTSFYYNKCQHCSFFGLCEAEGLSLEDW
jgi:CRISPR/Cas system-associated exonuclease Cas4 (RecB family)